MQSHDYDFRLPRLYVDEPLAESSGVSLPPEQVHYLKTVLRRPDGAQLRLFNPRDGEWLGQLRFSGKKDGGVVPERQIRLPVMRGLRLHLIFALIKKDRMDFLIEKAVELGVTDIHPVLSQYTSVRDINNDRVTKQILEAAEQCERMDIPRLHPLKTLSELGKTWNTDVPVFAALERENVEFIGAAPVPGEAGLLIGPEGGFSDEERKSLMGLPWIKPVALGDQILRSETAGIFGLSLLSGNFTMQRTGK